VAKEPATWRAGHQHAQWRREQGVTFQVLCIHSAALI